ncbi:CdaR family transcriptional regulator [Paenibacillus sp. J22TS3]|uniref:PucR family transcriptional regulator n=1 Tax=Paenibacillus sp. J22TS3 TaxID=2807192 RepID=UPI001B1680D3|nr:helix-turn-helix domain-containing protein [Paenibacillus sp. J22TS3]GIP24522.1 hypothetical protein J22TS3_47970 [Paenibacillus sp. J22TS3]
MDIQLVREKLERVVGDSVEQRDLSLKEWSSWAKAAKAGNEVSGTTAVIKGKRLFIPWNQSEAGITGFEMDAKVVTESEIRLIELVVEAARGAGFSNVISSPGDEEERNTRLGQWIQAQLDRGLLHEEIPDQLNLKSRLTGTMVPFLLSYENRTHRDLTYKQLNKLLQSYFDGDITLVPLPGSREWLILVGESLLNGFKEESDEGQDTERGMLYDLCQGVYELISNEWGGTSHLSVLDPITPLQSLTSAVSLLRESLQLGRLFHLTEHIHLPWALYLERLIYSIPDEQRRQFLDQTVPHASSTVFTDNETLSTLETFFQLDCNVSETAKRLYIHRNTLLYRMDKIKQETGLDVRSFQDAVLVKLTLLLCKVTKRK